LWWWWCGGGGMVVVWWTISDEWSGTHQRCALRSLPEEPGSSEDFEDGRHRVSPWHACTSIWPDAERIPGSDSPARDRQQAPGEQFGPRLFVRRGTPVSGICIPNKTTTNSMRSSRFNYEVTASIAGSNLVCQSVKMVADGHGRNVGKTEKSRTAPVQP
jgi:hypothetical protein